MTFGGDEKPLVSVKKNWMPIMTWKDDALILHAVPEEELFNSNRTKATSAFSLDLSVAEKLGLIEKPQGFAVYALGRNLQFTCPTVTYTNLTLPSGSSFRVQYNWNGEHYAGAQPTDLSREVMDIMYQVKNKRLYLSRMVEWQFNNLDTSFEKLVGTSKRTVMVYSDVVESTVVGSGKFPLLREVQLLRTGEGESTVEPPPSMDQSPRQPIGHYRSGDCQYQRTPGYFTSWQNHRHDRSETAIKTTAHILGKTIQKQNRDARREFNALPHTRGDHPREKRVGRRFNQTSRSSHRAASPSRTPRYPTRTEFGRHLVESWRAN